MAGSNGTRQRIRDRIAARALPSEVIEIPSLGESIEVRGMTVAQRTRFMSEAFVKSPNGGKSEAVLEKFYPIVLTSCCYVPGTGEPLFEPDEDLAGLLSGPDADRIRDVALRLSGLDKEAVETAGNGSASPSDSSPSS